MNHSDELIAKVQEALSDNDINVSKVYAKRVLSDVVNSIVELAKDGGVSVVGLGVFKYVDYAERQVRNPQTNLPMTIAATSRLKFKATKLIAKK